MHSFALHGLRTALRNMRDRMRAAIGQLTYTRSWLVGRKSSALDRCRSECRGKQTQVDSIEKIRWEPHDSEVNSENEFDCLRPELPGLARQRWRPQNSIFRSCSRTMSGCDEGLPLVRMRQILQTRTEMQRSFLSSCILGIIVACD